MKRTLFLVLAVCLMPAFANAQNIGINFNSDREDAALAPDESAGVVPQVNWNNWDAIPQTVTEPNTDNQGGIDSPNAGVITDSDGNTHPDVTVDWESWNSWNTDNGVGNGDNKLMNGYLDNNGDNPQITVRVGNLPSVITDAGYDVIAYIGSDGNGRTGTVTDGTTTYSYSTFSQQGAAFPDAYALTTDTADGNPDANYARFSGLSSAEFTITLDRGSHNSGLHGIQIVAIPEPGSVALALLGALGLVSLARRRR